MPSKTVSGMSAWAGTDAAVSGQPATRFSKRELALDHAHIVISGLLLALTLLVATLVGYRVYRAPARQYRRRLRREDRLYAALMARRLTK